MSAFKKFVPDIIDNEKMHIAFVYNIDIENIDCIKAFFLFSKSRISHYKTNSKFNGYLFENVIDVRGQEPKNMDVIANFITEMNNEENVKFRLIQ